VAVEAAVVERKLADWRHVTLLTVLSTSSDVVMTVVECMA